MGFTDYIITQDAFNITKHDPNHIDTILIICPGYSGKQWKERQLSHKDKLSSNFV